MLIEFFCELLETPTLTGSIYGEERSPADVFRHVEEQGAALDVEFVVLRLEVSGRDPFLLAVVRPTVEDERGVHRDSGVLDLCDYSVVYVFVVEEGVGVGWSSFLVDRKRFDEDDVFAWDSVFE